jgi:predicted dehydrogenase
MKRRTFLQTIAATSLTTQILQAESDERAKIVAGQIGTRHAHASGKFQAMRTLTDDYQVIGIVEPDETSRARASGQAVYRDVPWLSEDQLLSNEDLRVVAIETTLADAIPTALRAIEAGKHIHLDKPGGADHAAFARMRSLAEERGLTVQMGYMLRYNPAFELLFRACKEKWFGEIIEVNACMGKLAPAGLRRELAEHPGHGMFELACHLIDAVVTILGKPSQVTPLGVATRAPDDPLVDYQLAVLTYPRALATVRCNHADPDGFPRRMFEVIGSAGSLRIEPLESGNVTLQLSKDVEDYKKGRHSLSLKSQGGRYDAEFVDLAKAIRGEKALAWNAAHDIAVHETALRAAGV